MTQTKNLTVAKGHICDRKKKATIENQQKPRFLSLRGTKQSFRLATVRKRKTLANKKILTKIFYHTIKELKIASLRSQ